MGVLGCLAFLPAVYIFVTISTVVKLLHVWNNVIEFPVQCDRAPLPGNETGLKLIVAGLAKSGTRTICHALNDIGIRCHHSEDLLIWSLWDWLSSENARREGRWLSHQEMLETLPEGREAFAASISKCGVQAVALDGLETFFQPLYESSTDSKVIIMNWRTFPSWFKSLIHFGPKLWIMCQWCVMTTSSLQVLPWGALLRVLDPLVGGPVEQVLRDGGPPVCEVMGPMMYMYQEMINQKRQYSSWTWRPQPGFTPYTEKQYDKWHNGIKAAVPEGRMIEWDHRHSNYEELCKFAGVHPCPRSGKLPKAVNTFLFEHDMPMAGLLNLTIRFFFFWVNWRLVAGFLRLVVPARLVSVKAKQA